MNILESMQDSGDVWIKESPDLDNQKGLTFFQGYATATEYAEKENSIASNIAEFLYQNKSLKKISHDEIMVYIGEYEKKSGMTLHPDQQAGVEMIVNNNLSILTGGPGTGKTATIKCATYVLRHVYRDITISFSAPTGKAAQRITESTGEIAGTIQHILGLNFTNRDKGKILDADVLFIDESSMNDMDVTYALLNTFSPRKKLVWIGDADQMPSVAPGSILRDMINSRVIPTTQLSRTYRNGGSLLRNIKLIRMGLSHFDENEEFEKIILDSEISNAEIMKLTMAKYREEVSRYGMDNVCVLIPYHKVGFCSDVCNKYLQHEYNKTQPRWRAVRDDLVIDFKVGDPVMQTINRKECVNGEIGKVTELSAQGVTVKYANGEVKYDSRTINELDLAYSMSISKSQGSEYKSVIIVLLNAHTQALNRNALYTGVSRAKKRCCLITQSEALDVALRTSAMERKTFLAEKIKFVCQQT